jgi:signal transduction histidine kinase
LNVLTNAIDACNEREHGCVEVSTSLEPEENLARIKITDNGLGIEKEDLERVFSVFVSNKGGRGTGLGLPVTQKILQEHGGHIHVESAVGVGSCFTLEFPAALPPSDTQKQGMGSTEYPHVSASTHSGAS